MYKVPITAVSPCFSLELRDIHDFIAELGPYNGQYAAKFPKDWIVKFTEHLEQLKPIERQSAKAQLEKIKLALVDTDLSYDYSMDWRQNIEISDAASKYFPIVGDGVDPKPYKLWVDAINDIRESKKRTWKFHGNWSEFFAAIQPLLLNAPAAYIIDRYFDPCNLTHENLLNSLLNRMNGSRCYQLHVITRLMKPSKPFSNNENSNEIISEENFHNLRNKLDQIYKNIIPKSRTLSFHFVREDRPGGKNLRMHNRHFLTRFGAIDFGQGFDIQEQQIAQMDAYIVDKEHHQILCDTYINGVTRGNEKLPKKSNIAYPIFVRTHNINN